MFWYVKQQTKKMQYDAGWRQLAISKQLGASLYKLLVVVLK